MNLRGLMYRVVAAAGFAGSLVGLHHEVPILLLLGSIAFGAGLELWIGESTLPASGEEGR